MPKTKAAAVGHLVVGGVSLLAAVLVLMFGDLSGMSSSGVPSIFVVIATLAAAVMFIALGIEGLRRLRG